VVLRLDGDTTSRPPSNSPSHASLAPPSSQRDGSMSISFGKAIGTPLHAGLQELALSA
jgi:hypothetical protein